MTTFEPGASVVFTHGLRERPLSTAFFASSAAPIMTDGFDVLVHDVIAAIATAPWSTSNEAPSRVTGVGFDGRPSAPSAAGKCSGLPSPLPEPEYAGASEAGKDSSTDSSTGDCGASEVYEPSAERNAGLASDSAIRACGRFGPAIDGTTVDRSSDSVSEKAGSADASCHRPCSLAYASTSATCSAERPVNFRYSMVSPSIGKIAHVEPNSGLMLPIVARLASGTADTPAP